MSYYAKDGSKWDGAVPDENKQYLQCEKCGSKKICMVSHFDGADIYGYGYNCENGHVIEQTFKRYGAWEGGAE